MYLLIQVDLRSLNKFIHEEQSPLIKIIGKERRINDLLMYKNC